MKELTQRIEWLEIDMSPGEGVRDGLEFALVSPDYRQSCIFVHCKDFLQDAVMAQVVNERKGIYSFYYDPIQHPPVSLDKTRLLLTNSMDQDFRDRIPHSLDFLHQIERELKILKTKCWEVPKPQVPLQYRRCGVFLLEGSRRWLYSPVMISLYTLLIRVGMSHAKGTHYRITIDKIIKEELTPYQRADKNRLDAGIAGIDRILRRGDRAIFYRQIEKNYPNHVTTSDMHNRMGIVGFSQGNSKQYVPYWHREELQCSHLEQTPNSC